MQFSQVNGMVAHWASAGRADGPAIIFSNSLGTDLRIWDDVVARLGARYRTLTYDKRGHGLSELTPGPYSIDLFAADLLALADAQGLNRFALVGLSVGGLIAQAVVVRAPERLTALVICDTAAKIGTDETWGARIAAIEKSGLDSIAGELMERWFSRRYRSDRPAEVAGWRNMLVRTPAAGYIATCAALRAADLTAAVGTISTPTLVVAGEEDGSTPPALVRATAGLIPGARFEVIAGAGHLPCIEQPEVLARLIDWHISKPSAMPDPVDSFKQGMATRRAVLGDQHVDAATAAATDFDRDFQTYITRSAWGSVWSRPNISRRERSMLTIALLAAQGQHEEVAMHVRATRNTGASPDDIREALLHVAVYAGVPAANAAFKVVKKTLAEMAAAEAKT